MGRMWSEAAMKRVRARNAAKRRKAKATRIGGYLMRQGPIFPRFSSASLRRTAAPITGRKHKARGGLRGRKGGRKRYSPSQLSAMGKRRLANGRVVPKKRVVRKKRGGGKPWSSSRRGRAYAKRILSSSRIRNLRGVGRPQRSLRKGERRVGHRIYPALKGREWSSSRRARFVSKKAKGGKVGGRKRYTPSQLSAMGKRRLSNGRVVPKKKGRGWSSSRRRRQMLTIAVRKA